MEGNAMNKNIENHVQAAAYLEIVAANLSLLARKLRADEVAPFYVREVVSEQRALLDEALRESQT
jgi:hypothetical protein